MRLAILWIWKLFDPLFYFCSRLHYLQPDKPKNAIFRVRITKYKGKELIFSDGTKILKNYLLLKIHLHNVRLLLELIKMKNDVHRARYVYKVVLYSMPNLAQYLKHHPHEGRIKGIIGITTLHKGAAHLGFECYQPYNRFYRWFKKVGQLPISFLSNTSMKSLQKTEVNYLIMTKNILYKKYIKEMPSNLELITTHNLYQNVKN
jgi:hypothetical protein